MPAVFSTLLVEHITKDAGSDDKRPHDEVTIPIIVW